MGVILCCLCQQDIEKQPLLNQNQQICDYSTTIQQISRQNPDKYNQILDSAYSQFLRALNLQMKTVIQNENIKVQTIDINSGYLVRSTWKADFPTQNLTQFFNIPQKRLSWDTNIQSMINIQDCPSYTVNYIVFKKIIGISQRDLLLVSKDFTDKSNIISISTSIQHSDCPLYQNLVRMHLFIGGYYLENLGHQTRITSISKCDFGGNFPTQIIKKFTVYTMPKFAENCISAIKKEILSNG